MFKSCSLKLNILLENILLKYFCLNSRGALEAINVSDRQGYVKLMQQIIGKEFR